MKSTHLFAALAMAAAVTAPAAVVTNETLTVTEDTSWSGVTNLYSSIENPGSICANLTLDNNSYVRLIGRDGSNTQPYPQFYFATNANDVLITVKNGSAFYAGYRGSKMSDGSGWANIDDPKRVNDDQARPYIQAHVGIRDGAFGSTGAFKVKINKAANFGSNAKSPFWANWLYVESSVKTNAPGYIDLCEIGGDTYVYLDISHLENRNQYPVRIRYVGNGWLRCNNANQIDAPLAPYTGSSMVLEGDSTYPVRYMKQFRNVKFTARMGGTVYIRGKDVYLHGNNSQGNFQTWELGAQDNVVWEHTGTLTVERSRFIVSSHDVLPHAAAHGCLKMSGINTTTLEGACRIDLHGTTQHVNGAVCNGAYGKTETRFAIFTNELSGTVGTLVLGEHDFDTTLQARCERNVRVAKIGSGTLTLLDASGEYLDVTAGKVSVSGSCDFGTIALAEGTRLSGSIDVKTSLVVPGTGTIRQESAIVNLASGATIDIDDDAQLVLDQLTVNGAEIAAGTHEGETWLPKGRVIVMETASGASGTPTQVTWTAGGGADTSTATAANWGLATAPDLNNLMLKTVFAAAGAEAVFANALNYLNAIVFDAPGDFSLKGEAGTELLLKDMVETKPVPCGEERAYTVEPKITLIKDRIYEYTMVSNATVHLKGGLAGNGGLVLKGDKIGAGPYAYSTNGTLILENATLHGKIEHKLGGGWLVLRGDVGMAGDTSLLDIYYGAPTDGTDKIKPEAPWVQTGCTRFENVNVYKPVQIGGVGQIAGNVGTGNFFVQGAHTTNVFHEVVTQAASVTLFFGEGSTTYFNGGYTEIRAGVGANTWNGHYHGVDPSVLVFGAPIDHRESRGIMAYNLTMRMECAGSRVSPLTMGEVLLETAVDEAFLNTVLICSNIVTIDLCGTRQSFRAIVNNTVYSGNGLYYSARSVRSVEPAELVITEGAFSADQADTGNYRTNFDAQVIGPVTMTMAGAGTLYFRPHPYQSTGGLKVTAGTLDLADGTTWPNATALTVKESGTFKTHSANVFDANKVTAYLGEDDDSWTIDLPTGTSMRVAWAFDADGNLLPSGVYGNSAVQGVNKPRYSSHFPANGGVLVVARHGTSLIFR